jgi:protein arginine kinase
VSGAQPADRPGPLSSASIARGAEWLATPGPEGDVVISSRARLARNLAGHPFLNRAAPESRRAAFEELRAAMMTPEGDASANTLLWFDVHALAPIERTLLVERHLMSKEHAKGASSESPRALAVASEDERLAIMVNEEDHLRVQAILPGLALREATARVDQADDRIEARARFAFHPRFGYLTACPTNVGCGCRLSAMLHLPGLRLLGEMDKVRNAARDMAMVVRGYYGEGSDATGDLYQFSNQTTLGKDEASLLRDLEGEVLPAVIKAEREARGRVLSTRRRLIEDQVFRALGTLRGARLLTPEEAVSLLSLVRLGVLLGLVTDVDPQRLNALIVLTQPAHLQKVVGRDMDQQTRREARADLVRQRLGAS